MRAQPKELMIFSIGVQGLMAVRGLSVFALADVDAAKVINWIFNSSDGTTGQRWYIGSLAKDDVSRRCIYRHGGGFGCEEVTTATMPEPVMQCFVDIANLWWNYGTPSESPLSQTPVTRTTPQTSIPAEQPETIEETIVGGEPSKATYGDIWPLVRERLRAGTKDGTVPCTCGSQVKFALVEGQLSMNCPSCGFKITGLDPRL